MDHKTKLNKLLSAFVEGTKDIFEDRLSEIILFGSYARNDYDSESDLDLMILAKINRAEELNFQKQLVDLLGDIYEKNGYSIVLSPIIINSDLFEEWKNTIPFYRNVATEGVRLSA